MDEQGYSSCWIILSLSVIQQGRRQNKSTWHSFDCQVLRLKRECRKDGKRKERAQMEMRGKRASDGKRENSCQFWWPLTEKLKVCEIAVFPSAFLSLFPQRGMPKYDERLAWVAVTWHSTPSTRNPFCCHTHTLPLGVNCCNLCYASQREVRRRRRAAVGAFMLKRVYLTLEKCAGDCFNPFKACTHLSASVPSTPHHSDGSFSWNQVNGDINIFLRGYVTSYLVYILWMITVEVWQGEAHVELMGMRINISMCGSFVFPPCLIFGTALIHHNWQRFSAHLNTIWTRAQHCTIIQGPSLKRH